MCTVLLRPVYNDIILSLFISPYFVFVSIFLPSLQLVMDLPDSVLTYFNASSNRINTFEQLILEDLDDLGEV